MSTVNLGNQLNRVVFGARAALFDQGEAAQLTYGAFDIAARAMHEMESEEICVTFPVGYRADRQPISSTRTYRKEQLLDRYQFLAIHQLSVNGLVQLVATVEAMLGDMIRVIVRRYPQKLGAKRTLSIQAILEASSFEEIHVRATDVLLNELSYKSPGEFCEAVEALVSVNLRECPAFHRYVEIKATRDIFVHNQGVANEIYLRKAGSHSRVKSGMKLPADTQYFLESYEYCLQLVDWLEEELHKHWHSSDYEDRRNPQGELGLANPGGGVASAAAGDA